MRLLLCILSCSLLFAAGCSDEYYDSKEKVRVLKRKLLVDQVEAARKSQDEAKVQFTSALKQFLAVSKVPASELQATYEKLNTGFTQSESCAKDVRDRIAAIDDVAQALFEEWNGELTQYTNPALRAQSEGQLAATKNRYATLMRLMKQAAVRMDPVIGAFRDQVLFLKHNLNTQAVAALSGTTRELQEDIARLIADMEKSIKEADAFIDSMQAAPGG